MLVAVPVLAAEEVSLSTGQKDYYFMVGDDARIFINISNAFDRPLAGMLTSMTTESVSGPGLSFSSSYSSSQGHTAPKGDSTVTIDAGTSDREKTLTFSFSFEYDDPSPQSQVLRDISIHFVNDPTRAINTRQPVRSEAGTADQAGSSGASSQYQQQVQSVQQQVQQSLGISIGSQPTAGESRMAQDTSTLKQQLEQETRNVEADKEKFLTRLSKDPTFRVVNESLSGQGFAIARMDAYPESANTGTFSIEYRNNAGETVRVGGSVENGTLPEITGQTSAAILPPGPIATNASYRASEEALLREGYTRSDTRISTTPAGTTANQSYTGGAGRPAYLNATSEGTNVTSVIVTKENAPADYLLLLAATAIIAALATAAYVTWRRYRKPPAPLPAGPGLVPPAMLDFREEADRLLRQAEDQYRDRQFREAYGTAGQALRLFLSHRFGTGAELTNTEAVRLLRSADPGIGGVEQVLDRCSLVEFAKSAPGPGEFEEFTKRIRGVIAGE